MFSRLQMAWREYAGLDRRIWVVAGVRAVNTMGLSLVMAFMAIYLVDRRGISGALYGAIYLVANLLQSLAQGYAGEVSDRVGRRQLMTGSMIIRAGVLCVLGAQILWEMPIWSIAITIVVSAVLRGAFEPVAYALVADVAQPGERVAAFGLQRMGTNLGWAIGPALGGFLSLLIPYGAVFFAAAAVTLVASWPIARVVDPAHGRAPTGGAPQVSLREALVSSFSRADGAVMLLCALLFALCHVQLFSTMSIYAAGELSLSNGDVGLIYTVNGLAVLLLQMPAVALIYRTGHSRALVIGSLLYVVAFLGIGGASGFLGVALAVVLLTAGEVMVAPAQQAAAAEVGDPRRMGRAFGILGTMQMLGVSVAPLVGGLVFDALRHDHLAMWSVLAALPALTALGYVVFAVLRRRSASLP